MEYKLHNPSDPYTFIAEDSETAALTVFALSTAYGAESRDGSDSVPVFVFGGAEEWYQRKFGRTVEEGLEEKMADVAEALSSVMLGDFEDRRRYKAVLAAIADPEKREKFIDEWQDGCSSLTNIGAYAHALGRKLAGRIEAATENQ